MNFYILFFLINNTLSQYMLDEEGSRFASSVFNTMISCNKWIEQGKSKFDKYKFRTDRVLKDVLWHVLAIKRCTNETSARRRRGARTKPRKTSKKVRKQPTTPMEDVGMISDIGTLQNQVLNSIEGYGHIADNITEKDAKILFNEKVTTDLKKHQLNIEALYDAYTLKADTQGDTKGGITDASFRSVLNDFSEASEQRVSQSMKLKKACTTGISVLWLTQEVELCPKLGSWQKRTRHLHTDIKTMEKICNRKKTRQAEEEIEEDYEE